MAVDHCDHCSARFDHPRSNKRFCNARCRAAGRTGGVRASQYQRRVRRAEGRQGTFVGLDGEAVRRPDGAHEYVLLSIGEESLHRPDWSELTFLDCARFTLDYQRRHPSHIIVGFALGYDFAQWCKTLPESRAQRLFTAEGQAIRRKKNHRGEPYPVDYKELQIDFLPNLKRFRVRRRGEKSYAYVMDAFAFFQASFQNVLASWPNIEELATPEELALIDKGKNELRTGLVLDYGEAPPDIYRDYNLTENRIFGRLMNHLRQGFHDAGIDLNRKQWFGPGQAAQVWLREHAKEHVGEATRAAVPRAVRSAAQASYYGGWFEIFAHGRINGPIYNYDINSAYPKIISELPCLLHGTWDNEPGGDLELVAASVVGANELCGPAPYRHHRSKSIARPLRSVGWHWRHELEAAERAGLVDTVHVGQRWSYHACDCPPPFAGVDALYQWRIRDGGIHKNTPGGKSAKLMYNSMYGKMAQSVGHPAYSNPVYASLITSGCRTMILDAIATHPEGIRSTVMVATDGVYFMAPHPGLSIDPLTLGAWDETVYDHLYLNKPGSYWGRKASGKMDYKSRGVGLKSLISVTEAFEEKWEHAAHTYRYSFRKSAGDRGRLIGGWPKVKLQIPFSVKSIKAAYNSLNDWSRVGEVQVDETRMETTDPRNKRCPLRPKRRVDGLIRTTAWPRPTIPNPVPPWLWRSDGLELGDVAPYETLPYDGRFGDELSEQRAPYQGLTPDGAWSMLVAETFAATLLDEVVWN